MSNNDNVEAHLKVFANRSLLVGSDGTERLYKEGKTSTAARQRLQTVKDALEAGFLVGIIQECKNAQVTFDGLEDEYAYIITSLVDSVTSEVGRALVGIAILQLTIKSICPEQSVRLHKGSGSAGHFSWEEGIPMRVIDKNYITPILREYDLIRLNADGIMMTRSLAENYPYSKLYKAALRGARVEWLLIVDLIEKNILTPKTALTYLISCLINRSNEFKLIASKCLKTVNEYIQTSPTAQDIISRVKSFVSSSPYSARVFEVALHSIYQVLEESKSLEGPLKPLCQMRSANKKHGNIADIEVLAKEGTLQIIEAWDAKYGKPYLRDELEEINEKLEEHPETKIIGFVSDTEPDLREDIIERIKEIEELKSVKIEIVSFDNFLAMKQQLSSRTGDDFFQIWLLAIAESLCQERRGKAPIDEPCDKWVLFLTECFS